MKCTKSWKATLAVMLLACASLTAHAQPVPKLLVKTVILRLEVGETRPIVVHDESSAPIASEALPELFTFSSSDPTLVTVSPSGAVRAIRPGQGEIFVRQRRVARLLTVPVYVSPATASVASAPPTTAPVTAPSQPPTAVPSTTPAAMPAAMAGPTPISGTIQPTSIQLLAGERFRPNFRLVFADGTQRETGDVVWIALGSAIALAPNNASEVIGVLPGAGQLGGTYGTSISAFAPVTVGESVLIPDPDSLRLVTGALDTVSLLVPAQGRRRVTQNLTWRTTTPAVLRVLSPTAGIVQAVDAGDADLIVDGYGLTIRIPVRVTPQIAKLETNPAQGSAVIVGTGGTRVLEAKAIGTAGTVLSSNTLTWRIADTTLATIDVRGVVSGLREGTTRVTLDAPGIETYSWPLTVEAARVTLGVKLTAVIAGTTRKLVAQLRGSDQRDFGAPPAARFSSSQPQIATVDANGTVTGIMPGRATIIAAQPGAGADSVTVLVTGRGLVSGTIAGVRGIWQLVGANDTTPVNLIRSDSGSISQAVWSPDRTRIALTYESLDRPNYSRVIMIDADGQNRKLLSPDTISASDPSWTKDGKAVLMSRSEKGISAVLRVAIDTREVTLLASSPSSKYRYPSADTDSAAILVRYENDGQADLARINAGTVVKLTNGKPREELIARLRDGRVLLAVDSSSRARPGTLQWVTVGTEQAQTPTPVRVPTGLVISDISAGYDDGSVIVVARVRQWPGASGAALVVLRIALDGADHKVLMILGEKDVVTVRSD